MPFLPQELWSVILEFNTIQSIPTYATIERTAYTATKDDSYWRVALVRDGDNDERLVKIAAMYKGPRSFRDLYHTRRMSTKQGHKTNPHIDKHHGLFVLEFACPLDWSELEQLPGENGDLQRRCGICEKNVYNADNPAFDWKTVKCAMQSSTIFVENKGEYSVEILRIMGRRRIVSK
eukprot:PhF_6_TR14939/c0_g2_i7/m.23406